MLVPNRYMAIGVLMMLTSVPGRADNFVKVPGDDEYGIKFQIDWSVFDSGTFRYGPPGSTVRQIGGGRSGYLAFHDLTLDFSFKDGRTCHVVIDINALMREVVNGVEIFDNRDTRWGGTATVLIKIEENELALDYRVSERILEPDYELNYHYYPLYKRTLD